MLFFPCTRLEIKFVLSCLVSSRLISSRLVSSHLIPSHLILSYLNCQLRRDLYWLFDGNINFKPLLPLHERNIRMKSFWYDINVLFNGKAGSKWVNEIRNLCNAICHLSRLKGMATISERKQSNYIFMINFHLFKFSWELLHSNQVGQNNDVPT